MFLSTNLINSVFFSGLLAIAGLCADSAVVTGETISQEDVASLIFSFATEINRYSDFVQVKLTRAFQLSDRNVSLINEDYLQFSLQSSLLHVPKRGYKPFLSILDKVRKLGGLSSVPLLELKIYKINDDAGDNCIGIEIADFLFFLVPK